MEDNLEYKTPTEIIREFPQLNPHWTPNDLGFLYRLNLVRGIKLARGSLIHKSDVIQLFNSSFRNSNQASAILKNVDI